MATAKQPKDFENLKDYEIYRERQVGLIMEHNHAIQLFLRHQVEAFSLASEAMIAQAGRMTDLSEAAAIAARLAADSTGDIIAAEYGIVPTDFLDNDDDGDDEDDDTDGS